MGSPIPVRAQGAYNPVVSEESVESFKPSNDMLRAVH